MQPNNVGAKFSSEAKISENYIIIYAVFDNSEDELHPIHSCVSFFELVFQKETLVNLMALIAGLVITPLVSGNP